MSEQRAAQIAAGVADVRARIAAACERTGRNSSEVTLVAVTKTWPISDIELLGPTGVIDVGENRHQEAREKAAALAALRWHFLGQLQTNKAKAVAGYASVLESLDRVELLTGLSQGALEAGRVLDVLVQLSIDGDTSRGGCIEADIEELADRSASMEGLRLVGLMTVAPLGVDPAEAFEAARRVSSRLQQAHPSATDFSAGMSGDFEAAVEEGATIVRVGSAIFGRRTPAVG